MVIEIKIDSKKCKGCELCLSVCERDVIKMSQKTNEKSYRFAEVANETNCTACGSCFLICADVCIEIKKIARKEKKNGKKH